MSALDFDPTDIVVVDDVVVVNSWSMTVTAPPGSTVESLALQIEQFEQQPLAVEAVSVQIGSPASLIAYAPVIASFLRFHQFPDLPPRPPTISNHDTQLSLHVPEENGADGEQTAAALEGAFSIFEAFVENPNVARKRISVTVSAQEAMLRRLVRRVWGDPSLRRVGGNQLVGLVLRHPASPQPDWSNFGYFTNGVHFETSGVPPVEITDGFEEVFLANLLADHLKFPVEEPLCILVGSPAAGSVIEAALQDHPDHPFNTLVFRRTGNAGLDGTALLTAAMRCRNLEMLSFEHFCFCGDLSPLVQPPGSREDLPPLKEVRFRLCTFGPRAHTALLWRTIDEMHLLDCGGACDLVATAMAQTGTLRALSFEGAILPKRSMADLCTALKRADCSLERLSLGGGRWKYTGTDSEKLAFTPSLSNDVVEDFFKALPSMPRLSRLELRHVAPTLLAPAVLAAVRENCFLRELRGFSFDARDSAANDQLMREIAPYIHANARGRNDVYLAAKHSNDDSLQGAAFNAICRLTSYDNLECHTSLFLCLQALPKAWFVSAPSADRPVKKPRKVGPSL
jgi:hypothetical protein